MAHEISFAEREASYASARSAIAASLENELTRAESIQNDARNAHERATNELEAKRVAEHAELSKRVGTYARSKLATPWVAFVATASREAAGAFAQDVRTVAGEIERVLGRPWGSLGDARAVVGNLLWHVAVAALLKKEPEALGCFSDPSGGTQHTPEAVGAIERASAACLNSKATPSAVEHALRALEDAVNRVARAANRSVAPESQAIYELVRGYASPEPIAAGLKAIDAQRKAREIASSQEHQDRVNRARMGDDTDLDPTWAAEIRKLKGRIVKRGDGRLVDEFKGSY